MNQPTPAPSTGHGVGTRILVVAAVVALLAGYAALVFVTRGHWMGTTEQVDATRVVFTATAPDGSPAPDGDLAAARDVVEDRLEELSPTDAGVSVDGSTLVVTAEGPDESAVQGLGGTGNLHIRPVIHSIPAQAPGTSPASAPPTAPPAGLSQRISDEKSLRQSKDQNIQVLALQFQASRCADPDELAGHDDPTLPLVTCSQDGTLVYVLSPSIIDGDHIDSATWKFDRDYGQYLVDLEFDSEAARTWADFTAANVGTQTAFTLDTAVVSAPEIREAIPGGRTQIAGSFTEDSARELAGALNSGPLPVSLTVESSSSETITRTIASNPLRIALGVAGVLLIGLVVGTVVYVIAASRHREGTRTT